ncbi:MAG: DUF2312 domain-containing protein [Magnetococcales bacterium]|nr:DUF2312 domain-containing protein [Magnetococcales bacterium]
MSKATQTEAQASDVHGIAGPILIQYLERIERLEEEKSGILEGIREVFAEAKGNGFDVKIMRELLKLRKMERDELDEQETMLHLYRQAIGMH